VVYLLKIKSNIFEPMAVSAIKFGTRPLSTNKGIVKELKVTAPDSVKLL
jgi:hypothetical protein